MGEVDYSLSQPHSFSQTQRREMSLQKHALDAIQWCPFSDCCMRTSCRCGIGCLNLDCGPCAPIICLCYTLPWMVRSCHKSCCQKSDSSFFSELNSSGILNRNDRNDMVPSLKNKIGLFLQTEDGKKFKGNFYVERLLHTPLAFFSVLEEDTFFLRHYKPPVPCELSARRGEGRSLLGGLFFDV